MKIPDGGPLYPAKKNPARTGRTGTDRNIKIYFIF